VNLIVVSDLTLNEGLYFRFLSMTATSYLEMDVIVEAPKNKIDYYFNKLKRGGYYDYVAEILSSETREEGVRLDTDYNYPLTVTAKDITCINVMSLIGQIKMLGYIDKDTY
tara:strand:+ start:4133 stop:4465 length:333 start_codon:yes stop_codon:yes gene_type:complete